MIGTLVTELLDIEEDYTLRKLLEEPDELLIDRSTSDRRRPNDYPGRLTMIPSGIRFITGLVCVLHDVTEQENERERREFVSMFLMSCERLDKYEDIEA